MLECSITRTAFWTLQGLQNTFLVSTRRGKLLPCPLPVRCTHVQKSVNTQSNWLGRSVWFSYRLKITSTVVGRAQCCPTLLIETNSVQLHHMSNIDNEQTPWKNTGLFWEKCGPRSKNMRPKLVNYAVFLHAFQTD